MFAFNRNMLNKVFAMEKLKDEHKLMAYMVAVNDATPKMLREITDYTAQHVSRIIGDPLFLSEVDRLRSYTDGKIKAKQKTGLELIANNIETIIENQISLSKNAKSEAVRSNTADRLMRIFMPTHRQSEEDESGGHVMVQSKPQQDIKNDPDVSPNAAKAKIVKFKKAQDG